jgi:chitin disaccharide deacetylase
MKRTLALTCFLLCSAAGVFSQTPMRTVQEKLGYPASARLLIIHADDLGMAHSVNRATFEALEKGWVTSASILVPCPWFPEVARWAQTHPDADLGIHLALNSEWTGFRWMPVSPVDKVSSLLDDQGYFPLLETQVAPKAKLSEVETELRAQIERARKAGIRLSHLDTHMTALTQSPGLFQTYKKIGKEYRLPLLLERNSGTYLPQGQTLSEDALIDKVVSIAPGVALQDWLKAYKDMLQPLPPGVYQLIVHTAYDDDEMRGATWDHPNWGAAWRQFDFETVKSPEFQQFLKDQGFILIRWRDLAKALPANYSAGK